MRVAPQQLHAYLFRDIPFVAYIIPIPVVQLHRMAAPEIIQSVLEHIDILCIDNRPPQFVPCFYCTIEERVGKKSSCAVCMYLVKLEVVYPRGPVARLE